ncbi:MAG: Hsp70 family protein [bacterium]|nr:Hsp70 family protein [bacterium]
MEDIIGIDLGTTNSSVGIIKGHSPMLIENNGERLLPSVVGISPGGELLVGTPAKNQYILAPERTIKSIKRQMGCDVTVPIAEKEYTPQEISGIILKQLKTIAENALKKQISKAVITVPAYFSDSQRQATKDAGELAGLEVVRIINEPTAAALAYGADKEEDQHLMVYDLGGGTFDVSIVELSSGVIEVLASHGNNRLGGDDFDQRLVDHIARWFERKHKIDVRQDRQALARLTRAAEQAKIELSDKPYVLIREEFIAKSDDGKPLHLEIEISREKFKELIQDLLDETLEAIDITLSDAGLENKEIDKVLLVGGSTRIPAVADLIEKKMGISPHAEVDPEECVTLGAAIQAGIISGHSPSAVLVDVVPYSLGIAAVSNRFGLPLPDIFCKLIQRNTAIPVSKSEVFSTFMDNQKTVEIEVYQGESPIASQNVLLGKFKLEDVPEALAGKPKIIVQFDYDVNGILHVSALNKDTSQSQKLTIKHSRERMGKKEKQAAKKGIDKLWQKAKGVLHRENE